MLQYVRRRVNSCLLEAQIAGLLLRNLTQVTIMGVYSN